MTLNQHVCAEKAHGGTLWETMRCQKQKRNLLASDLNRRGQILSCRPLSERRAHIDKRLQLDNWECDAVIGAAHKQDIATVAQRKGGYGMMATVANMTTDMVGSAVIQALKPVEAKVKTLAYDNGKEFSRHAEIDKAGQHGSLCQIPCEPRAWVERGLQWSALITRA